MTFALVGNPNCGKTALFNRLTASKCRVGNFPGVTVEKKSGTLVFDRNVTVVDLPGVYSLSAYTEEERVTSDFLLCERPDCVINVIDATSPERGLRLSLSLFKLKIPTVIAFNMSDELSKRGGSVDVEMLSRLLGVEVVSVSAVKKTGLDKLAAAARKASASKIDVSESEAEAFVSRTVRETVVKGNGKRREITEKIDGILCHPIFSVPIFLLFVLTVFFVTFGSFTSDFDFTEKLSRSAEAFLLSVGTSKTVTSLVCDGVISGVGSVLEFVPVLAVLFTFLAFAEESGYAARAALIFDGFTEKIGLSGRSVIPLLLGFGCSVPAVISARGLSCGEKRKVVYAVPFISCSAKIAVYSTFVSFFFAENGVFVIFLLYLLGIFSAVLFLVFADKFFPERSAEPFIIELPLYRMPTFSDVFGRVKIRVSEFAKKAFSVIFLSSVAVWFLMRFDLSFAVAESPDASILATVSRFVSPIFAPLGFSSWQVVAALLSGLLSKESVVATLSVLTVGTGGISSAFSSSAAAMSFLIFILLYSPCVATLSALKRETGKLRGALFSAVFQTVVAYVFAAVFYRFAA